MRISIMWEIAIWSIAGAIVGSFGTAYIHQRLGRDVTMGGILGMVIGAIGSFVLLAMFWAWLYYMSPSTVGRVYGTRRKEWYRWWD
jgi:uncharacterized membrane protein YeaQ/YmgE (transglycosylase-associated protein family)